MEYPVGLVLILVAWWLWTSIGAQQAFRRGILAAAVAIMLSGQSPAHSKQPFLNEIYNIYASVKWSDHGREISIIEAKIAQLRRCGIDGYSDYTLKYAGMTDGLRIVLTGVHPSAAAANAELQRARRCGIEGYMKRARAVQE